MINHEPFTDYIALSPNLAFDGNRITATKRFKSPLNAVFKRNDIGYFATFSSFFMMENINRADNKQRIMRTLQTIHKAKCDDHK